MFPIVCVPSQVSDREIFDQILAGANIEADSNMKAHAVFLAERAELLLHQAARYGLHTRCSIGL